MSFRSMTMLESWLEEFRALKYPALGDIRVIVQDSDAGADSGLVSAKLRTVSTVYSIEPVASADSTVWNVTFEPRDQAASLSASGVLMLSSELGTLSALCAFLQAKSEALPRARPTEKPAG